MCKAHSKVEYVKQRKYFHHLKGCGYNKWIVSKFGVGEEVLGPHLHTKFLRCGLKRAPKIANNSSLWYEFAPKGKTCGSI